MNERLGYLAHELRNLLSAAFLAFDAIKSGSVAVGGATGRVLDRSLIGLRDIIDRSLAEVRLTAGLKVRRESMSLSQLLEEVQVSAAMEAKARGAAFIIAPVDVGLTVEGDRQMLCSALLDLQNAFKFTRRNGSVTLRTFGTAERVLIEIEDECGGLPPGRIEELFQPFEQRSDDRSGLVSASRSAGARWKPTAAKLGGATGLARAACSSSGCRCTSPLRIQRIREAYAARERRREVQRLVAEHDETQCARDGTAKERRQAAARTSGCVGCRPASHASG